MYFTAPQRSQPAEAGMPPAAPAFPATSRHPGLPAAAQSVMPELPHRIIALATLLDLSEQMGARTCRQYIGNYISMWDGRFARLVGAAETKDLEAAMDVVLSIKISSHMAGAERLSALAAEAQAAVAAYDFPALDSMVEAIGRCGADTMAFLSDSLAPGRQDRF